MKACLAVFQKSRHWKFTSRTNQKPELEYYPFYIQYMTHLALEHHFALEGSRYCKGYVKRT